MIVEQKLEQGARIKIPVSELEFVIGGNTIWVHSPIGATVLRIKTGQTIQVEKCDSNPCSHLDVMTVTGFLFCLADDAQEC